MRLFIHWSMTIVLLGTMATVSAVSLNQDREIDRLRHELTLARQTADARKQMIDEARLLQKAANLPRVLEVTVTAYNPLEEQCDADPTIAASMRPVRLGTIAVSRDLFDQGWVFGRKVRIEGLGIFEINDLMNKRFSRRIDVFMWDEGDARAFGKRVSKAALLEI